MTNFKSLFKKDILSFALSFFLLAFCLTCYAEKLEISGHLSWLKDRQKLQLVLLDGYLGNYREIKVDSAVAEKGIFKLSTTVIGGPRLYFINIIGANEKFIHLMANNGKIKIEDGPIGKLPEMGYLTPYVKITGSSIASEYGAIALTLSHIITNYDNLYKSKLNQIEKGEIAYDKKFIEGLISAREVFMLTFISELRDVAKRNLSGILPQLIITSYRLIGKDKNLKYVYEVLSEEAKNSYYGKLLKEMLPTCIGQKVPNFSLKNSDDGTETLNDVIAHGKLTVLHFWTTDLLRSDLALELSGYYRKYHDKGLNIINVYVGTDSLAWKNFVAKGLLEGHHAADFKGMWDGIGKEFGFTTEVAPFTILLDKEGKIISWLDTGAFLQYYIENTLN